MTDPEIHPQLFKELKTAVEYGLSSGDLMIRDQIDRQLSRFAERFGPAQLARLDGEALLREMHGRDRAESRCLAYWLEFKRDDEFMESRFGGIGGGTALKYEVFQRKEDGAWVTGQSQAQRVISVAEAIAIARRQRDELLEGSARLSAFDRQDISDRAYLELQRSMENAAPNLAGIAWAHKYWFLLHSDILDDYHSPRFQRFHLLKLLLMPTDGAGTLALNATRFTCAGRFISLARALDVHVSSLNRVPNQRDRAFHRYWRVGTTAGDSGESQWPVMHDRSFVSAGWHEYIPDLSQMLDLERSVLRERIRRSLTGAYPTTPAIASRKAGEILNLAVGMAEEDLVLACNGRTVLGIGRVTGPYSYDDSLTFPHKRAVEWRNLDSWSLPQPEGLQTSVIELGKSAENILETERRLFPKRPLPPHRVVAIRQSPPRYGSSAARTARCVYITRRQHSPSQRPSNSLRPTRHR